MNRQEKRVAAAIKREAVKRGDSALDVAQVLGVYPTTVERWFRRERFPQRRHRKQLAEHWGLPFDAFEVDLEAEEQTVRTQLDRIEAMLQRLLEAAGLTTGLPEDGERPEPRPADLIPPEDRADAEGEAEQA